jgi:hypothetical protein
VQVGTSLRVVENVKRKVDMRAAWTNLIHRVAKMAQNDGDGK